MNYSDPDPSKPLLQRIEDAMTENMEWDGTFSCRWCGAMTKAELHFPGCILVEVQEANRP